MIESNLAVLLAERNLRISKVSADTGISRTTLTALCNDYTGGMKFETLDTLCKYLNIEPAEFFNYTPYDYAIEIKPDGEVDESEDIVEFVYKINVSVIKDNYRWNNEVLGFASMDKERKEQKVNCFFELDGDEEFTREEEKAFEHFEQMVNEMSQRQRKVLDTDLGDAMKNRIMEDVSGNEKLNSLVKEPGIEFVYNSFIS